MSFVDGNLGTWPKEKRLVILLSCLCAAHLKYTIPKTINYPMGIKKSIQYCDVSKPDFNLEKNLEI